MSASDFIEQCNGCEGSFEGGEISNEGYCEACEYEYDAKQDYLTGGDNE
ncbi:hypothetical protein [Pseudoalteromonas sp.]